MEVVTVDARKLRIVDPDVVALLAESRADHRQAQALVTRVGVDVRARWSGLNQADSHIDPSTLANRRDTLRPSGSTVNRSAIHVALITRLVLAVQGPYSPSNEGTATSFRVL